MQQMDINKFRQELLNTAKFYYDTAEAEDTEATNIYEHLEGALTGILAVAKEARICGLFNIFDDVDALHKALQRQRDAKKRLKRGRK